MYGRVSLLSEYVGIAYMHSAIFSEYLGRLRIGLYLLHHTKYSESTVSNIRVGSDGWDYLHTLRGKQGARIIGLQCPDLALLT